MTEPLLFTPIRIGALELKNRLVMAPVTTGYASKNGRPTGQLLDFLDERARGGVALVTLEACSVDRRHREVPRSMHFSDDDVIGAHRILTDRIHASGAAVQPQLVHPGPDGLAPYLSGIASVGPSVIPSYLTGTPCRELDADEIDEIVAQFGAAARRIRAAGYDGIELHAAHGYMLLGSFLSPWRNRRTDAFAGNSMEGRLELPRRVLAAIQAEAGQDFPVTVRVSGYERVPGGRALDDTPRLAAELEAAGAAAFHVSGGVIDRLTTQIVTGVQFGDAHNVAAAAAVKHAVDVPVMAVGRIHDARLAEEILRRGEVDLIAMARPLLADPELPAKAAAQCFAEIRPCISCQTCIDSMETGPMACAVNGRSGHEGKRSSTPAARSRRVLVVGAGPAGMEAARIAALRGHRVTLCDRQRMLGGALVIAAAIHPEVEPLLAYLTGEIERHSVEVRLGNALSADSIAALAPDVAIVATGARVLTPALPGDELPHVLTASMLRSLLRGDVPAGSEHHVPVWQRTAARLFGPQLQRLASPANLRTVANQWIPPGARVAIVGADLGAVGLAEFMARGGRRVSILAFGRQIAGELGMKKRTEHMDALDRLGVSVNTGVVVDRITAEGVVIRARRGERLVAADSVILGGGVEADTALFDAVASRVPEAHAIGDCTGLGLIRGAIDDAVRVACAL